MIVFPHGFLATQGEAPSAFSNTYSVDFDGVSEIVQLGDVIAGAGDKSVAMWIKPNTITTDDRLLSNYDNASIAMSVGFSSSAIRVWAGTNGWQNITTAQPSTGSWSHLVMVWSGTGSGGGGTVTGYINGGNSTSCTLSSNVQGERAATFDNVSLGAKLYNVYGTTYHGNMDEVGIWDVALDADAVTALYNSGSPIDLSSDSGDYDNSGDLQAWYRMGDSDTHPTLTDNAGSNDGTMVNMDSGNIEEDTP